MWVKMMTRVKPRRRHEYVRILRVFGAMHGRCDKDVLQALRSAPCWPAFRARRAAQSGMLEDWRLGTLAECYLHDNGIDCCSRGAHPPVCTVCTAGSAASICMPAWRKSAVCVGTSVVTEETRKLEQRLRDRACLVLCNNRGESHKTLLPHAEQALARICVFQVMNAFRLVCRFDLAGGRWRAFKCS